MAHEMAWSSMLSAGLTGASLDGGLPCASTWLMLFIKIAARQRSATVGGVRRVCGASPLAVGSSRPTA